MNGPIWAQIKQAANAGVLAGGYPYARQAWYCGNNMPIFATNRVDTLAQLLAIAQPGDIAFLGPQAYEEGNLVIPESLSPFTIIGSGNRGSSYIEPLLSSDEGLQILADDVTLINVGVAAGGATGAYAIKVGSQTISPNRFRAYGCKFEGVDAVNPGAAVVLQAAGDTIIDDCEICWSANGILFQANDEGYVTQCRIKNNLFHNLVTVGVGIVAAGGVRNLQLVDNVFDRAEDGTASTDDILLSDNANTGIITGNRFPRATNGTGFITIGTGLIYNPNGTEAGWSTARPA